MISNTGTRKSKNSNKTQEFYEFVLVDTGSILLFHTPCKYKENRIAYSKCTIKYVLSPTQWGSFQQKTQQGATPWELRKSSQSYNPQYYTYFDYLMVRYKTFLFQNDRDQHSWLFFFDRFHEIPSLPQWFIKWWSHFRVELKTLPPFQK